MINASKEFKEKLKAGANVVNYADVTLSDGEVLHLEPKDFMVGGCQIEDKTTDGKFGVGFCIGKTATLRLANHDEQFSDYDFYGSTINLYVAMQLDNGTVEKIRKGVFYTTVPETPGDIIQINAVDGMYRLDRDYSESTLTYPATLQQIITGACLDCGIPIGFTQFDNMGFTVATKPENAKYRQVVSYACQIAGYNAHIDNNGYMQLVWYDTSLLDMRRYDGGDFKTWPHDTILDGGDFTFYAPTMIIDGGSFTDPAPENVYQIKSLNVSTDDIVITGVQVVGEEEENTATAGESGYMIKVDQNPFASGKEQEVAAYLGARMIGLVFRAFSAEVLGNPLYEPFEVARVYDRKGNMYLAIINSVSYTVGGYTQIACEAEDPIRNGSAYLSASAQAVVEARRNTKKQITEYDKAVQNMSQLAANTLGYHVTYGSAPDGGRITYMHDKPNLGDSQTIYKIGINGFFVSQDGGQSYTAGFDANGNEVVNLLYAIGIVADWIRSGRFECRKGNKVTFLADVDTGEVQIVADSFSLSSGKTIDSIAKEEANKKCKTFTSTPVPPYNVGDIWMNSTTSDIMTCVNTRSTGSYVASDWQKRNKYIDQAAANTAASNAVNAQTQESVFNKLTNNGQSQGVYLENGNLYVNASYIKSGTLVLGGANNVNGKISIRNASNTEIGRWDNNGIYINGGSVYCKTSGTGVSIDGGRMFLTHGSTDVGYIGTNYISGYSSYKGIVFDLENTGAYMTWAAQESVGGLYYIKMLYASKTFSDYVAGKMYMACDVDFQDYEIQNAYIKNLRVKGSLFVPNNTNCEIYSDINMENYTIKNLKIQNLVATQGYAPFDGSIPIVTRIENNSDGGITWYHSNITVKNGIITSAPTS